MNNELAIREIMTLYTEGTYEGSREKLSQCFHPKATMSGYLMGELVLDTPESFIVVMENSPIKDAGAAYQAEITHLEVGDKVAAVTLKESGFPGGINFTDFFHFINDGTGWKIISKVFHTS